MANPTALSIEIQDSSGPWVEAGILYHKDEKNWFEFSSSYWDRRSRPILGQVFEEHGRGWQPRARMSLPHWFSHLLPEGRLREAVAMSAQVNTRREFQLLARLGLDDLPGAVRAIPVDAPRGQAPANIDPSDDPGTSDPILKFSLAGVQLKFSVFGGTDGRFTVPASGSAGNFILKFPDNRPGFLNIPEAELGCLTLAREIGIKAPNARLVPTHSVSGLEDWAAAFPGNALAVERFDRTSTGGRVHMEEVAQIIDITASQEQAKYTKANFEVISTVLGGLAGVSEVAEIIDRITLNVFVGNGDAHLKNWAVIYPNSTTPTLSPVYDVVPTILYLDDDDLGLNLGGTKNFDSIRPESFRRLGDRTEFGGQQAVRRSKEAAERIGDKWHLLRDYFNEEAFSLLSMRRERFNLRFSQDGST